MGLGSSPIGNVTLNSVLSDEERVQFQDSRVIQSLLRDARTIAVVGLSTEKTKASNMVASYLLDEGYDVIPIHPKATEILGQKAFASLSELPEPVDIVNVFRPSGEVESIVEASIAAGARAVWTQLRIVDLDAAKRAKDAGLHVVVDRCIKIEHGRYCGALHWAGMNTQVISAKRPRR
ncbi:MAG: CoA-binding protein [Fimbriimonadaceae bacterium]|nr:CoA-binding protein [Fimbriimonadaceae bacterium]